MRVFGAHRVAIMSNSAGSSDDSPGNREAALLETSLSQSITESVAVIRHGSKVNQARNHPQALLIPTIEAKLWPSY